MFVFGTIEDTPSIIRTAGMSSPQQSYNVYKLWLKDNDSYNICQKWIASLYAYLHLRHNICAKWGPQQSNGIAELHWQAKMCKWLPLKFVEHE